MNHSNICEKMRTCFVIAPGISAILINRMTSLMCWLGDFSVTVNAIFATYKPEQLICGFFFFPNLWGAAYIQVHFIVQKLQRTLLEDWYKFRCSFLNKQNWTQAWLLISLCCYFDLIESGRKLHSSFNLNDWSNVQLRFLQKATFVYKPWSIQQRMWHVVQNLWCAFQQ